MAAASWKIAGRTIPLADGGLIMGVLNVTPDSFSDGGQFFDTDRALSHALEMAANGAAIIDIGGESTRPGAEEIAEVEELRRVIPVISRLAARSDVLISIDTSKAVVAREALDAGAHIINDITGGRADDGMMALAAERGAGLILMHMQGTPRTMQNSPTYADVVAEVREFFRQQYDCAVRSGIDPITLAFDPGIGFGKTLEHNLALLRDLGQLRIADRPLVVGVSRKSMLGKLVGSSRPADRLAPTVAFTALLRERGADVIRVHDVAPNVGALRATEALLGRPAV
ncbi:MAG: dihydropteroate synthase [Verrucomicrobiota bacterium]|nr:dihydropteroate synthase [Verrucomicrobiota bacterium]